MKRKLTRIPEALVAAVMMLLVVGVVASAQTGPNPPPAATPTPAPNRGPDRVTIDKIKNLWEGVNFNHTSHVGYADKCASCHHNSPEGVTPACSDCHRTGNIVDSPAAGTSLKAAFHKQCIGCHRDMGAGPTDHCVDCHARRAAVTPTQN